MGIIRLLDKYCFKDLFQRVISKYIHYLNLLLEVHTELRSYRPEQKCGAVVMYAFEIHLVYKHRYQQNLKKRD